MRQLYIVPAPGLIVRDPEADNTLVPKEGKRVNASPYWWRQVRDGSVTIRDEAPRE